MYKVEIDIYTEVCCCSHHEHLVDYFETEQEAVKYANSFKSSCYATVYTDIEVVE